MNVSDSSALEFFSALAVVGTAIVIVGVVLEVADLIVKFRGEMQWRRRVVEIFGTKLRCWLVLLARYLKPKLYPFEVVAFAVLILGLVLEFLGSSTAERLQSKANSELEATNVQLSWQVAQLVSTNLALQRRINPRTIDENKQTQFVSFLKNAPKKSVLVLCSTYGDSLNLALTIRKMLDDAGFADTDETHGLKPGLSLAETRADGLWITPAIKGGPDADVFATLEVGSEVWPTNVPTAAFALWRAFKAVGVDVLLDNSTNWVRRDGLIMVVQPKPGF